VALRSDLDDDLPLPRVARDDDGWATEITTASGPIAGRPGEVTVAYGREMARAGDLRPGKSRVFAPGPSSSAVMRNLHDFFNRDSGYGLDITFESVAEPIAAWRAEGGGAVAISAINSRIIYGDSLLQNRTRTNWGRSLAPGTYSRIVSLEVFTLVTEIPGPGSKELVRVAGLSETSSETRGTKAR
jgi:hypothetical protein